MLCGTIIALNCVGFTVTTACNTLPLSFSVGERRLFFFKKLHTSAKIVLRAPIAYMAQYEVLELGIYRWKRLCLVSWAAALCIWTLRAPTRTLLTYLLTYLYSIIVQTLEWNKRASRPHHRDVSLVQKCIWPLCPPQKRIWPLCDLDLWPLTFETF